MTTYAEQITNETGPHVADGTLGVNIRPGSDDDGWQTPSPVALGDGTIVQLFKDGEALAAASRVIEAAKQRICLEVYIFSDDTTGQAIAEQLSKKARDGLQVYVIYDSFGSMGTDQKIFGHMKKSGVKLNSFHPVLPWEVKFSWRPFNRNHRKLLIIDNDIAGMGGINVGGEYAGSWVVPSSKPSSELWRDNAIGIQGPAVRLFQKCFARSWNYLIHGGRIRRAELLHPIDGGVLGVLASVPSAHSHLSSRLHSYFASATKSIRLTMAYFVPNDSLIDELCRAARRGVDVQLMLPAVSDAPIVVAAARSFYEKLMAAGVKIYERQKVVLHSKTMCVDQNLTVIGSTNLDYRSIEYNLELSAIIRSPEFGRQMHELFDNDVRYSIRIDPAMWRHRPWRDRFGQWAVSRARYLL